MKPMTKLNGDAKVIVERIENLKESLDDFKNSIQKEFKENRDDHEKIFDILVKHGNMIIKNSTFIKVGWALFAIVATLITKIMIG